MAKSQCLIQVDVPPENAWSLYKWVYHLQPLPSTVYGELNFFIISIQNHCLKDIIKSVCVSLMFV